MTQPSPPAIVARPLMPSSCATPDIGLVTFAIDQTKPIAVKSAQSFIIAMRGGAGESFIRPYQMRATPTGPILAFDREFTLDDATFANADRAPGAAFVADGPATQYFVFRALVAGTTTVTFDEFEIGNASKPYATKTFTIVVSQNFAVC